MTTERWKRLSFLKPQRGFIQKIKIKNKNMKIQAGHDVLSLFGMSGNSQALTKKSKQNAHGNFMFTLVGAFLIVVMFGFAANMITQNLSTTSASASNKAPAEDILPVAYQPGQFISQKISQGYLGNYR